VISAGSKETAEAGASILSKGGNAVDAAVAASLASYIAEIGLNHVGGSGVAQTFRPETGEAVVYDFFSTAPGLGLEKEPDHLDFETVVVNFGSTTQEFRLGRGSVAVPGNIFGLCKMLREQGTLPLYTLVEPALKLAEEGVVLNDTQLLTCRILEDFFLRTPEMAQIFAPQGHLVAKGEKVRVPHLADTLRELAARGEDYLRTGRLGEAILSDQRKHGGLLTRRDLQEYKVLRQPPVRLGYREDEILLPAPCSTGGVLTAFTLKLAAAFEVREYEAGSAEYLRFLVEVQAATNRARQKWDLWVEQSPSDEPVDQFLDDRFVGHYISQIQDSLAGRVPSVTCREPKGSPNTTHISVIDRQGMAVSLTTSAGESAGFIVPGTGFILNNMLGEADLHPHGFHRHTPGERFHTMMTPVIALKNGRVQLVAGTGGSNRIRSATLQLLLNFIDHGMPFRKAVDWPRVHLEDGTVQCELGTDHGSMDQLEDMGYKVNRWTQPTIYFGGTHTVGCTAGGQLGGAGDRRRGGVCLKSGKQA
jgi:gamma-glutamyltranspeptidase/glutathione hydrolase